MSAKPETTFTSSVHKHLPLDIYRMKNHNVYNGGIADVWYDDKKDLWAEYKFIVVPKRDDTIVDLVNGKKPVISALQQEWLRGRYKNGRQVCVIVGSKNGGVWFGGTEWQRPLTALEFRGLLKTRKELADIITQHVRG
jgi:hypothetical protein